MPKLKKTPKELREEALVKSLKKGLIDKGYTVAHLAKLCKMDPGNLSRMINHPMSVKLDTVLFIASKLGIDSIPVQKGESL